MCLVMHLNEQTTHVLHAIVITHPYLATGGESGLSRTTPREVCLASRLVAPQWSPASPGMSRAQRRRKRSCGRGYWRGSGSTQPRWSIARASRATSTTCEALQSAAENSSPSSPELTAAGVRHLQPMFDEHGVHRQVCHRSRAAS